MKSGTLAGTAQVISGSELQILMELMDLTADVVHVCIGTTAYDSLGSLPVTLCCMDKRMKSSLPGTTALSSPLYILGDFGCWLNAAC